MKCEEIDEKINGVSNSLINYIVIEVFQTSSVAYKATTVINNTIIDIHSVLHSCH